MQPTAAAATQDTKAAKEPVNKGKYLTFASGADFEEAVKALAVAGTGETETARLDKWEKKYGFYSLRADYAKKKKAKEAKALADAQMLRVPDGEVPVPLFEPYAEPWDEGLIIEDDLFAAMLSPEGTVEIDGRIFHIDLPNNIVSYIPTASPVAYTDFVAAQPTVSNTQIRYFGMNEDVLALLAGGDEGTVFGASANGTIRIGFGIGCGDPSAKGKADKANEYYASNRRLDCKLVYQPLGIYHSIVAKAHHQKKTWYGAWLGSPAKLYITTPGAFWQQKCESYEEFNFGSYTNYYSLYLGDENGDHNTVTHRYLNYMKGLKRYKVDVKFEVGQFRTRIFHIEDKW